MPNPATSHPLPQNIAVFLKLTHYRLFFGVSLPSDRECPNIVLIGVPHLKSLNRVLSKLKKHQIVHYAWSEPDYDFGMSAIATAPLDMEQKKVLQEYRVWRAQSSNGVDGMSLSQPAANAQVAQSQSTSL